MARNDPQMNLRVPMELKENIEKAALNNGRTITAEAVYRLEQSFNNHQPASEFDNMPFFDALGVLNDLCEKRGFQLIVYNKNSLTPDKDGYVKIKTSFGDIE